MFLNVPSKKRSVFAMRVGKGQIPISVSSHVHKEAAAPAVDICGLITAVGDSVMGTGLSAWM